MDNLRGLYEKFC